MKRQHTKWEKIFPNEATDKRLISKNIQIAHIAQNQKTIQQKVGRRSK